MKLRFQQVSEWPKLSWAAYLCPGEESILVRHGSAIEQSDHWFVEAIWVGEFGDGDFDRTDLVFGTGARLRDNRPVFVSAGSMTDRLWYCRRGLQTFVSNSLPCLLACADVSLRDDYRDYDSDIETQHLGLNRYKKSVPADKCSIQLTYFRNLVWDGTELTEVDKPDTAPDFNCFKDYHEYLGETMGRLGANLSDQLRQPLRARLGVMTRSPLRTHPACYPATIPVWKWPIILE